MNSDRKHARTDRPPTLAIEDLSISFIRRDGALKVVNDISIDIWPGEIVGVIGESGSGKTLTALSTLRMLPKGARVTGGDIRLNGNSIMGLSDNEMRAIRGDRVALIPQDAMQALNPTMKIGRQVGEPLELHRGLSIAKAKEVAVRLLHSVHIPQAKQRADAYAHQFSGGMQQRAMIAMGLALDPELIIADEPTTALDVTVQAQVLKLIKEIRDQRNTSVLFITHDLGIVARLCDWVYVMQNGQLMESGSVAKIFSKPENAYTRMLLAATPSLHRPVRKGAAT